ncbi:MAG: hypothetical protein JO247_04425 [Chloroflexi bacterium]|nr:hypothetical protein [Chloroflexota bacterium]
MSGENGPERPVAPDLSQLLELMSVRSAIAGTAPMPRSLPRQAGVPAPTAPPPAIEGHWAPSPGDGGAAASAEPALPEPALPEAPPAEAGAPAGSFGVLGAPEASEGEETVLGLDELETTAAFETTPLEDTAQARDEGPVDIEATEIVEVEGELQLVEIEPETVADAEAITEAEPQIAEAEPAVVEQTEVSPDFETTAEPEDVTEVPAAEAAATSFEVLEESAAAAEAEVPTQRSTDAVQQDVAPLTQPWPTAAEPEAPAAPQPQALEWRQASQREPAPVEPVAQRLPDPIEIVEVEDVPAATYEAEPSKQSVELALPPDEPEPGGQVVEDPQGIELLQPADEVASGEAPPLVPVSGNVKIEAINGPRRGAKFLGKSTMAGASGLTCLMDRFDLDAGTPVKLSLIAPRFADQIDIDDALVLASAARDDRKIQVDLDFEQPHEDLERFIERYFSARPATGSSGFSLFGRFKR